MLSTESRGNDVEVFLTAETQWDGSRGLRRTTLGKVVYFFEHQGNDLRRDQSDHVKEGVWTVWAAVLEYVTAAGTGQQRRVDPVTGCDVFILRKKLTFYPVSAIRRVEHMVHNCPTRGANPCRLVRENGKRGVQYLLNKNFHSFRRDPIA